MNPGAVPGCTEIGAAGVINKPRVRQHFRVFIPFFPVSVSVHLCTGKVCRRADISYQRSKP